MANLSYEGIYTDGTFKLDAATATAIAADPEGGVGKVVTIVGNETVGFGTSGKPLFGVITKVEHEENGSEGLVATVRLSGMVEDVPISATSSKHPAAGDAVAVDGTGRLAKLDLSTAAAVVGGVCFAVNTSAKTAVIQLKA